MRLERGEMRAWAAALLLGAACAAAWSLLGIGLRSECEGDGCVVGPAVDLIAAAVAVAFVVASVRDRHRSVWWLGAATLVLLVPLARSALA